jgi:hypothetical protein
VWGGGLVTAAGDELVMGGFEGGQAVVQCNTG